MSEAHHRSKQPEQLRAHLVRTAIELIVSEGYHSLTLDTVAKRAGVSKGGLQYHFSSKTKLLRGVCDALSAMFEPAFTEALAQEPAGPKQVTRAYIRSCFAEADPYCTKAIIILCLALPEFAREQGDLLQGLIDQDCADAPDIAQMLLLCRFAADGLWGAEASGVLHFDEAARTGLLNRLMALVDSL